MCLVVSFSAIHEDMNPLKETASLTSVQCKHSHCLDEMVAIGYHRQVNIPQIPPNRAGYSYNSVFSGPPSVFTGGKHSINSSYQTGPMPGTTPPKLFANKSPLFSEH